jgi:hypothetical protein
MLGKLACRAAAEGLRRMVGQTLANNAPMLALARKAGFTILPSAEVRGLMLLERQLQVPSPGKLCIESELSALAA